MTNRKTHLETNADILRDIKDIEKKRVQQGYSNFSVATSAGLTIATNNASAKSYTNAVHPNPLFADITNDVISTTSKVFFLDKGFTYFKFEIGDNAQVVNEKQRTVSFQASSIPSGVHFNVTLDFRINTREKPTINFIGDFNAEVVSVAEAEYDTYHIWHFTVYKHTDGVTDIAYIGGTLNLGGGGGGTTDGATRELDNLRNTVINTHLFPAPSTFGRWDLGKRSARWRHIYARDLRIGRVRGNDIDAKGIFDETNVLTFDANVRPSVTTGDAVINSIDFQIRGNSIATIEHDGLHATTGQIWSAFFKPSDQRPNSFFGAGVSVGDMQINIKRGDVFRIQAYGNVDPTLSNSPTDLISFAADDRDKGRGFVFWHASSAFNGSFGLINFDVTRYQKMVEFTSSSSVKFENIPEFDNGLSLTGGFIRFPLSASARSGTPNGSFRVVVNDRIKYVNYYN